MKNVSLEVKNLSVTFKKSRRVVDNVSFYLAGGETLCLVGESGCGKTTVAQAIMQLFISPDIAISNGQIFYKNENIINSTEDTIQNFRKTSIGYIPQNPLNSFDPRIKMGKQITECYVGKDGLQRAAFLLKKCQLDNCNTIFSSYPDELSGGMLQRIAIVTALMNKPSCIIADEPTTALDAINQLEILNLLSTVVREQNIALLMITHDLRVVHRIADRVIVMKDGKFIEEQEKSLFFKMPIHPYTQLLIKASLL